ncbi:MAG: hypothetical protein E7355_03335 [Clostridiales bacterium]|nr:hypothetical protein [Clostridiales bacterium]
MGLRNILRKPKKDKTPSSDFKKLKLLVTVVNRSKTEFFIDLLSSMGVNLQSSVAAQGTAKSETLSLLGLEDSDKSVIFSVIREDKAEEILRAVDERFHKLRGGKGIAFTIPLSSVIGVAMYRFLSDNRSIN